MANMIKDGWSGPSQVAFSSSSDQALQYAQQVFAIISALRARGWTVARSSNGTTASAADNIATSADIVFGTEASQAHSWAALVPPTGKGNPTGGVNHRILINCNNSSADTTPQNIDIYLARGTYVGGANGTTTTRPSILAGGVELAVLSHNVIPWTAALAGSFCTWSTDDGDLYVMAKANGDSFFRSLMWIRDDPDNAAGNYNMTIFAANSSTADIVTSGTMQVNGNHRAFLADGTGAVSASAAYCVSFNATLWTNGVEATTSRVHLRDIEILNNASGAGARDFGALVDVLGGPTNVGWNQEDVDATAQNSNQWPVIHRTVGDLAMPCSAVLT